MNPFQFIICYGFSVLVETVVGLYCLVTMGREDRGPEESLMLAVCFSNVKPHSGTSHPSQSLIVAHQEAHNKNDANSYAKIDIKGHRVMLSGCLEASERLTPV